MAKSILAIVTILALSTSGAFAAQKTKTHHRHAMNAYARVGAPPPVVAPSPVIWTGGVSGSDREMYFRNLRDSGYNPKNNFNANGTIATQ
jgi:hypothetical protein